MDEDSLKRLTGGPTNMFGNSINYFCDLSQNKENFMTRSAFYMGSTMGGPHGGAGCDQNMEMDNDNDSEYCYSDFMVTSQITLSGRKIKKLPKVGAQAPKTSQSMSHFGGDPSMASSMAPYKGFNDKDPYHNPLYSDTDYYNDEYMSDGYHEPSRGYGSGGGNSGYSSYNDVHGDIMMNGAEPRKAKKMLPTVQPKPKSSYDPYQGSKQQQQQYQQQQSTYPNSSYQDERSYNGYDNHVVEKRHEAVTKGSLMNDRVSSLKSSRSRSTTPVSSSSSSNAATSAKQLPPVTSASNNAYLDSYQGYDAMSHVTISTSANQQQPATSQYSNSVSTSAPTQKLLPKPVPSAGKQQQSGAGNNYLASPEKKPPLLRRSPELSDPYDTHLDPYDMGPVSANNNKSSAHHREPDPYLNDRRGSSYGDVHRNDPYGANASADPYDVHLDDPDAGALLRDLDLEMLDDGPMQLPAGALKKAGTAKDANAAKKQLHFFDEREECFDEELQQLEHSIGEKQFQHQLDQLDPEPMMPPPAVTTASAAMDKIDPMGGLNVTGIDAVQADISKDITQQQAQGKRENFNARDKWLWAYDQIINVSTRNDLHIFRLRLE